MMPSDDLVRDFMERTDEALKGIQTDVRDLMKFRWMVMGGAAVSSFLFTVIFEIAKVWAGGK
jgi:hypothetical protein